MKHTMRVMNDQGDTKYEWETEEEAAIARDVFNELCGKGYLAVSMSADGSTGAVMQGFDASASNTLVLPPIRGG